MPHDELSPRASRIIRERKYESPIEEKIGEGLKRYSIPFRVQEPIGPYFADIFIPDGNIVIECDGKQHNFTQEYDRARDEYMTLRGYRVIRIRGSEIMRDELETVSELVKIIETRRRSSPETVELANKMNVSVKRRPMDPPPLPDTPENWEREIGLRMGVPEYFACEYAD